MIGNIHVAADFLPLLKIERKRLEEVIQLLRVSLADALAIAKRRAKKRTRRRK